jgi:Glycosyltransferase family 87
MKLSRPTILKIAGTLFVLLFLGLLFYFKASQNFQHQDYKNSNFFFFWLSGHMVWTGENPYNQVQWLAGHDASGTTWRPNKIFPYPLPLMFFLAPLGLLTLGQAYFSWQILSQLTIAATVYALLRHWPSRSQRMLLLPMMVFLLFFGPVYLSLQIGSIGPFALLAVMLSVFFLEKERSLPAGMLLSLTILKPPQGLPLLALAGIWFLSRRDWKAILGIFLGLLALLAVGLVRDPSWLIKFRGASGIVLDRTLGVQSNVFGFAYLGCNQSVNCMWVFGTLGTILILGLGGIYLWHNHNRLTPWEAFNIMIPLGFLATIYLWSYDQILYIIPITWIAGKLIEKTRSFLYVFLFLIVLDLESLIALGVQAYTHKDLLSILTTILVLVLSFWLYYWKNPQVNPLKSSRLETAP